MRSLVAWANQFETAKRLLGVRSLDLESLIGRLRATADQQAAPGEAVDGEAGPAVLSDEDRKKLAEIDTTIRMLKKNGLDATVFENIKKKIMQGE